MRGVNSKLRRLGRLVLSRLMREDDIASSVDVAFRHYLGRRPSPPEMRNYIDTVRRGRALPQIMSDIEHSPEAEGRRQILYSDLLAALHVDVSGQDSSDELSDGDFVVLAAELLFHGRGALAEEVEHWSQRLAGDRGRRLLFVKKALEEHVAQKRRDLKLTLDPDRCSIMGTGKYLTSADWQERAKIIASTARTGTPSAIAEKPFRHSGRYTVSAIASLYRGGRYIKAFLDNITNQTIFDQSELIIIDADSPEGEGEIIARYQEKFPNIVYKRMNYRIGIYEAWNVGVALARGKYLTNTNLDDLRAANSFELQAEALDRYGFVDVVHQDFFYSFDSSLSFDEVAAFGFKSDVPTVTRHNLLRVNSPHNAPMWRKTLHDELGLFDTSFKSAGDWEFWLRCAAAGKTFFKINTPHVIYFQNPLGISTRPDTRGLEEGFRALRLHSHKLISPELRMSRSSFCSLLGMEPGSDNGTSRYDMVQRAIDRLGSEFRQSAPTR